MDTPRSAPGPGIITYSEQATPAQAPQYALLDACGLSCPLPLLKAKQALLALAPGKRLLVMATDPGSVRDFRLLEGAPGQKLLDSAEQEGVYYYLLEKLAARP